jgi:hypothetical protein
MGGTLRLLRTVQFAMLFSILLYGVVGEVAGPRAKAVDPSLSYVFSTIAVALVGIIFVVRRTLVLRPAETLAVHPDDALALNYWKTGYVVTYALCEALALVGFASRFLGYSLAHSLPYYAGGFVLLIFFRATAPSRIGKEHEPQRTQGLTG